MKESSHFLEGESIIVEIVERAFVENVATTGSLSKISVTSHQWECAMIAKLVTDRICNHETQLIYPNIFKIIDDLWNKN